MAGGLSLREGGILADKRYYWIQLKEGFFKQKEIKKLRKIAGGDTYTVIYLKMLLKAVQQGNKLYFEGVEETFHEEIALELDEDPENVKVTIAFLERQGLIRVLSEDEVLLSQCEEMVGSESESAARVRRYREKKALQSNGDVTPLLQDGNTDIEKDIDTEKDIEIKKDSARSPERKGSESEADIPSPVARHVRPSLGVGARQQSNEVQEADVAAVILNDGTEWRPDQALFAEYVRLYPNVDVKQQFNEMRGWCLSNPAKRKTPRGIKRFVNGWLSREQDRGGSRRKYAAGSPGTVHQERIEELAGEKAELPVCSGLPEVRY